MKEREEILDKMEIKSSLRRRGNLEHLHMMKHLESSMIIVYCSIPHLHWVKRVNAYFSRLTNFGFSIYKPDPIKLPHHHPLLPFHSFLPSWVTNSTQRDSFAGFFKVAFYGWFFPFFAISPFFII